MVPPEVVCPIEYVPHTRELSVRVLRSAAEVRALAEHWDRLWQRSEVTLPTVQAEPVASWLEHFSPAQRCHVIAVQQGDQLVAVLPLRPGQVYGRVPVGDLTSNCWLSTGELLLDPETNQTEVLRTLSAALDRVPWPLCWLDMVPADAPRWQALLGSLRRAKLTVTRHDRYRIGRLPLEGSFSQYFAACSRSHRQSVRKRLRQIERRGPLEFRFLEQFQTHRLDQLLHDVFTVEQQGKKSPSGCVLHHPGMFAFYRHVAEFLADRGQLRVAMLLLEGEPIAFELGWLAKRVYHCHKIGYSERFACYSPGHLLRMKVIERLFDNGDCLAADFQGPITEAVRRWTTQSYPIARVVIAPRRTTSRLLMCGYRLLAPVVRQWRRLRRTVR